MECVHQLSNDSKDTRHRRVLALCGDTQVGLWVLRSLARQGLTVFAVCNSKASQAAHSRYCAGAWAIDRGPGAPSLVDQLDLLAHELEVGSIMPIAEGHHLALIESRDRFEPDIHLFSPAAEPFAKATDKDYLHSLAMEMGIPVAKGATLDKLVAGRTDELQYPLVLRTRRQTGANGSAPWKAAYAKDKGQLERLYCSVERFADNVIVQEYHPGVESHVQILMHKGEAFMLGQYMGQYHMPLAGGVTVQRVTCHHEAMVQDAVRLLKAIDWDGIAAVQFHYDQARDRYILLEINPRFCGGLPTVIMAGFDAPYLLWQSHFQPDEMKSRSYRIGLRTRILGGHANWLLAMLRRDPLPPDQTHLTRLGALSRFLWNFGPWTKDDSFAWNDPKPFFVDLRQMISKRLRSSNGDETTEAATIGDAIA